MGNKEAVDRLDDPGVSERGSKKAEVVAAGGPSEGPSDPTQLLAEEDFTGGDPPWTRTMNPEIKSLLLYH